MRLEEFAMRLGELAGQLAEFAEFTARLAEPVGAGSEPAVNPVAAAVPVAEAVPVAKVRPPAHWAALVNRATVDPTTVDRATVDHATVDHATAPALDRETESWRPALRGDVQCRPEPAHASRHWTPRQDLEAHDSAVASNAATTVTVRPPVTVRPAVTVHPPVTVRALTPRRPIVAVPDDARPVPARIQAPTPSPSPTPTSRPTPATRHTEVRPVGERPHHPEPQTSPASWPELLTELDGPDLAPRTDERRRLDRLIAEQEGRTWNV
jgi:hypothetical protein